MLLDLLTKLRCLSLPGSTAVRTKSEPVPDRGKRQGEKATVPDNRNLNTAKKPAKKKSTEVIRMKTNRKKSESAPNSGIILAEQETVTNNRNLVYVLDTSAILDNPAVVDNLDGRVIVPRAVLQELGQLQKDKTNGSFGKVADAVKSVSRAINKKKAEIWRECDSIDSLGDPKDKKIMGAAKYLARNKSNKVVMITTDQKMLEAAQRCGIEANNRINIKKTTDIPALPPTPKRSDTPHKQTVQNAVSGKPVQESKPPNVEIAKQPPPAPRKQSDIPATAVKSGNLGDPPKGGSAPAAQDKGDSRYKTGDKVTGRGNATTDRPQGKDYDYW